MARKRKRGRPNLLAGDPTVTLQFKLPKSMAREFKRLVGKGKTRAGVCRTLVLTWIGKRRQHEHRKAATAERARNGAQYSVPLLKVASKKKKRR